MAVRLLFLLPMLAMLLAGCQFDLPPMTRGHTTPLDAPFTLNAGQSIAVADEPVTLRLEPWSDDKRCPADASCGELGTVRVQITLWREGRPTTYPVFEAATDLDGNVLPDAPGSILVNKVGPYLISISSVTPYPATAGLTFRRDLVATFTVNKDPTARLDTDADMSVIPDVPFTLAPGEQVPLVGRTIALRVDAVVDARCAAGGECPPDGGVVTVDFSWLEENEVVGSLQLTANTDAAGKVQPASGMVRPFELVDGAGVRLLNIQPHPAGAGDIAQGDYRVTLMLEAGPRMPNGSEFAESGEPFSLGVDRAAVIGQDVLRVRFDGVIEDSRCPSDVLCVQAGSVHVAITVATSQVRATSYVLGGETNFEGVLLAPASIEHEGFTVRLLQVTPYPQTPDSPIAADAYVATFVVDVPADLIPTPLPARTPTATPDAAVLPLLCVNDFALIRMSSGDEEPAIQLTEPLPQSAAVNYLEAHPLCNRVFGPEWVPASPSTVEGFSRFLPAGQTMWLWDGMTQSLVRFVAE